MVELRVIVCVLCRQADRSVPLPSMHPGAGRVSRSLHRNARKLSPGGKYLKTIKKSAVCLNPQAKKRKENTVGLLALAGGLSRRDLPCF